MIVGKLGCREPRYDVRTLRLARYLTNELKPPPRVHWSDRVTDLGSMRNNELGDCTVATFGHMIQTWSANAGNQVIVPDDAIVKGYVEACGYVPGRPETDQGGVLLDVLNYVRNVGLDGHRIGAYAALDPMSKAHIELGIDLFGAVALGVALPLSAKGQEVWSVSDAAGPDGIPGSWGGHAVPVIDYGPSGLVCISWGQLITMTWRFFATYVRESYAVLSTDWCDGSKQAPSGFDLAQLQADLAAIAV